MRKKLTARHAVFWVSAPAKLLELPPSEYFAPYRTTSQHSNQGSRRLFAFEGSKICRTKAIRARFSDYVSFLKDRHGVKVIASIAIYFNQQLFSQSVELSGVLLKFVADISDETELVTYSVSQLAAQKGRVLKSEGDR